MTWKNIARWAEEATGPSPRLDKEIAFAVAREMIAAGATATEVHERVVTSATELAKPYTASVNAMLGIIDETLPGWWVSCGLCGLTGHASLGPDYNGSHGERLRREFPVEQYDEGFHADLAPGDGMHRVCLALIHVFAQAMSARSPSSQPSNTTTEGEDAHG